MQGVTAGYSSNGTLLWEAFSTLPTVWATALPNGDVCATGGYDALITCWRVSGVVVSNQPPTAALAATPSTGAAPLTVSFYGSGSADPDGTIASYSWNFGDGGTSTAANPGHTYATAGTYLATLTVTDNNNTSASAAVTIIVNPASSTVLRSTAINLSATLQARKVSVTGNVVVRNTSGAAVSGVVVSATWAKPAGATAAQTATTNSTGIARFSTTGGRGTYTLTVGTITRTGYTFDAANSILTRSIAK
jgi:PKD repeat protein